MKKYCFTIILLYACFAATAQNIPNITGSWIKTRVTFKDGTELGDDMQLKYDYLKYKFSASKRLDTYVEYNSSSTTYFCDINGNVIQARPQWGGDLGVMKYVVEKITKDSLILLEDKKSLDLPQCARYYFVSEASYQQSIPLTEKGILFVKDADTVYRSSSKVYATYKGEKSFHQMATLAAIDLKDNSRQHNDFIATFIVDKNGVADSLHIVQSVNPEYDAKYIKMFNKLKHDWLPATYNGKAVSVQMTDGVNNLPNEKFVEFNRYLKPANEAMGRGNYELAVYNYSKALHVFQADYVYYELALCQFLLGKNDEACLSLLRSEALGNTAATGLKKKFCK